MTATTLHGNDQRNSIVCGLLDRMAFPSVAATSGPRTTGPVLAGFVTNFNASGDCHRLKLAVGQGVFLFSKFNRVNADVLTRAVLTIDGFRASRPVQISAGQPWHDSGIGDPDERGRSFCSFRVAKVTAPWVPGVDGWGRPLVPSTPLASFTGLVRVANHRELLAVDGVPVEKVEIDVTPEVRAWLSDPATNFGFSIRPDDTAMYVKANSDCFGDFYVRLTVE